MTKQKNILFLGGLRLEIEAVKIAHEMGARVLVADYYDEEHAPAKQYADESYLVSATDDEALFELAREKDVNAVFTGYSDALLPHYAKLCERLHLPAYCTQEQAELMTDKGLFKQCCRQYGVSSVFEYSASDIEANLVKYPVIVKPVDRSGSFGIRVCNNSAELKEGIATATNESRSGRYIVERYMTGDEAVLYYYMQDGEVYFAGMCDRYVNHEREDLAQLPTAYIFPSKHTEEHLKSTDKAIKEMLKGIGLKNGPLFLQAFIEDGRPVLYEPGYRLCGARDHAVFSGTNNIDMERLLLKLALNGSYSEDHIERNIDPFLFGKYACKLSPLLRQGTVCEIKGLDYMLNHPSVHRCYLNNNVGDTISEKVLGTLLQIAYRCYIVEDSMESLAKTITDIQNHVTYYDENGTSMMMSPFDASILL